MSTHKNSAANLLAQHASQKRTPTTVTFQVTDRCNYDCTHCYQEHEADNELSTVEIFDCLEQLAESGVLFLSLMGGEYFMHPDADAILQKAHDLGFAIKVLSTGHHITEKRADFLMTIRPLQVDMSIYGSRPELHEAVTRQAGSWKRTFSAAKRLIERKIPVLLKTPLMESNVADYENLRALAASLGTSFTCDPKITASEAGDQGSVNLRMSESSLKRLYSEPMADYVSQSFSLADEKIIRPLNNPPCNAGQGTCFINPRGEVWPCGSLPLPVGDMREQSFHSIWTGSDELEAIRTLRWADISECNECPVRNYCNRCHGMALVEQGMLKGPSLEACRHAVAIRDSLRDRGVLPETDTALPPTWDRVEANGQHDLLDIKAGQRRSIALRILQ